MNPIVLIILAILLPPLAVFLKEGAGKNFIINLLLTVFLLWIGGVIHAVYLVTKK
jgi:uncharacterized membrane protein YqaE (UPF0057 family)